MNKPLGLSLIPAIQWHEGMLLSPQHLQQNDLRFEQILHHHMKLIAPYHWGVSHLKLDPIVLPDGLVRVLALQAVMPDGLVIDYEATSGEDVPLEVDIKPFKPLSPREEITISLAISFTFTKRFLERFYFFKNQFYILKNNDIKNQMSSLFK